MQKIKIFFQLFVAAIKKWAADKCSRLAAALAFYTGLALAPLLIVLVVIVGFVLSGSEVQGMIREQAVGALGDSGAEIVDSVLSDGFDAQAGLIAASISLATILFSASSLFAQLQDAFDTVWGIPDDSKGGIIGYLFKRLKALVMVFSIGLLIVLTVVVSTVVAAVTGLLEQSPEFLETIVPGVDFDFINAILQRLLPFVDYGLSLLILTFVFGWMFKSIPRTDLTRRDVRAGAFLTTILFVVGKAGLAWYLSTGSVGSAYGAAGSLLVLLVWVYYSAQIMLLGAEYSYIDAHTYGSLKGEPDTSPTAVPSPAT